MSKPPGPVTVDDELDRETLAAAARGVVEQLKRAMAGNPGRTVRSLSRPEIENIAQAAVSFWIVKRSEQVQRGVVPGSFSDFLMREMSVPPLGVGVGS